MLCANLVLRQLLGIPCCVMGVADKKSASQQFIMNGGNTTAQHLFDANNAFLDGSGWCALH